VFYLSVQVRHIGNPLLKYTAFDIVFNMGHILSCFFNVAVCEVQVAFNPPAILKCLYRARFMRHGSVAAPFHRQTRLSSVECLNETFLVHTEQHGFVRRLHIKTNDVMNLLDEIFVTAKLERLPRLIFFDE
jgi:hypothetical protein